MIDYLYNDDAQRLWNSPDINLSEFKLSIDTRIKAIKDVRSIKTEDIIGHNDFVALLADKNGIANGTFWAISCAENQLETFIYNILIPELNKRDKNEDLK